MWIRRTKQYKASKNLLDIVTDPENEIVFSVNPDHDMHQLEIVGDDDDYTLNGGVVAFFTRSNQKSEWQPFQKDGAAYTLTVAAAPNGVRTVTIPVGSISEIKVYPTTTLTTPGSVTKFGVYYLGGRNG